MAKFRYSMQNILNIKLKLETQAKQEFSAAKAALDEEEERLQALKDRKCGYEQEAERLLAGRLDLRKIEENKAAIRCMEDYIELQRFNVSKAERKLEEATEKLKQMRIERKTHETLKDKAFEEFLMEEKRQESKEIDQLTSYTCGQRINMENAGEQLQQFA